MKSRKSIRPGWSRKLKRSTASTTPMAMPATNARGNDTMPPITAAASAAHERARAERRRGCWPSPLWPAMQRERQRRQRAGDRPHEQSTPRFGLMPLRRARSRFSAEALTLLPNVVRVRNHARNDGDERDHDQDRRAAAPVIADRSRSRAPTPIGLREPGAGDVDVGVRGEDGERELGDADRGHQHDDARRVEQPPDDRQLESAP